MDDLPSAPSTSASASVSQSPSFTYPFAASPDIIRANQKDAYYLGLLLDQTTTILRNFFGARILHTYSLETKALSELLYLSLTTLRNTRTLGEEYCDILYTPTTLPRRAGYILTSVLTPYILSKSLPKIRARLRAVLSRGKETRIKSYLLENLDALTNTSNLLAVHLAIFYFSGAYYHLSKRVFGLRYIFSRRLAPHEQRIGYEVLGVLLLSQLLAQAYFHASSHWSNSNSLTAEEEKTSLLAAAKNPAHDEDTGRNARGVRDLEVETEMGFLKGEMGRKCTLCLELMKDPTATGCGHVFCWSCISEWCRNKPECPLCRQSALVQQLLPLRT